MPEQESACCANCLPCSPHNHAPLAAVPQPVLERTDVREALSVHDFGRVFALVRQWGGVSYSKIAQACDIKPERVGQLAQGHGRIVSYAKVAAIADGLRVPGSMVGLAPRPWEI